MASPATVSAGARQRVTSGDGEVAVGAGGGEGDGGSPVRMTRSGSIYSKPSKMSRKRSGRSLGISAACAQWAGEADGAGVMVVGQVGIEVVDGVASSGAAQI